MPLHKKILVVDDDKAILEAVAFILGQEGYEVSALSNGLNIEEYIYKHKPDALLLDLWLPGMDGNIITQRLKKDPRTKYLPIILFSASIDVTHIAKKAGANAHLTKPFDIKDLISIIKTHA
jgi:two-component system alkaline phosphatase synthesis response regulator PhoP